MRPSISAKRFVRKAVYGQGYRSHKERDLSVGKNVAPGTRMLISLTEPKAIQSGGRRKPIAFFRGRGINPCVGRRNSHRAQQDAAHDGRRPLPPVLLTLLKGM